MKLHLLGGTVLLTLAACASHLPRCAERLTPINQPSLRPAANSDARRSPRHPAKARRS